MTPKGRVIAVFARDETSLALLETMGFGAKSSLTTDVAFALPFTMPADKEQRDLANGPIKVGVNVSALLYRRDLSQGDKIALAADYPALIDTIFELPGMSNVEKVVVDESTIDENKPPLLVYREAAKQA